MFILSLLLSLLVLGCTQQVLAMDETRVDIQKALNLRQSNRKAQMIRDILDHGDIGLSIARRAELKKNVNDYYAKSTRQNKLNYLDGILFQILSGDDQAVRAARSIESSDGEQNSSGIVEEKKDKELDEEEGSGPLADSPSGQGKQIQFSDDDDLGIDFEISYIDEFDDGGKLMDAVRCYELEIVRELTYFAAEDPVQKDKPEGASNHQLFCYFFKAFNYIQKNYSWIKKILLPDGRVAPDRENDQNMQAFFSEKVRSRERAIYDCVAKAMLTMQRLCKKDSCKGYEHRWNKNCDKDEEGEDCNQVVKTSLNNSVDTSLNSTAGKAFNTTEVSADFSRNTRSSDFEVSEVIKHLWYGNDVDNGYAMLSLNKYLLNKIVLNGYNLLHNAVIDNEHGVVKLLCEFGGDLEINKRSRNGNRYTALHLAILHNRPKILDKLLTHNKIEVNKYDVKGRTALHLAALKKANLRILRSLLNNDDVKFDALSSKKSDVISFALESTKGSNRLRDQKMLAILEKIKEQSQPIQIKLFRRMRGGLKDNLLHCLVRCNYIESLRYALCEKLIGPTRVNQMGDTPLMVAVKNYNIEAVKVLCDTNAIHYRASQYEKAYQNYKKVRQYIRKEYEWIKKRKELGVGSYVSFLRAMKCGANITKEMIKQEKIYDLVAGALSVVQKFCKS